MVYFLVASIAATFQIGIFAFPIASSLSTSGCFTHLGSMRSG